MYILLWSSFIGLHPAIGSLNSAYCSCALLLLRLSAVASRRVVTVAVVFVAASAAVALVVAAPAAADSAAFVAPAEVVVSAEVSNPATAPSISHTLPSAPRTSPCPRP